MLRSQLSLVKSFMNEFGIIFGTTDTIQYLDDCKILESKIKEYLETIQSGVGETPKQIRKRLKPNYLALDKLMLDLRYDAGAFDVEIDTDLKKVVVKHDLVLKGKITEIQDGILPENILIKGNLIVENLLLNMNSGLVIEGDLRIEDENIRYLPEDIIIRGDIWVGPQLADVATKLQKKGQVKSVYGI